MTDKELLEAGYTEYEPSPIDGDWVVKCFQKKFKDENGIRYYIHVKKSKEINHHKLRTPIPSSYTFTCQFNNKVENTINLELFSGWTIEDAEKCIETLFQAGGFVYYDNYRDYE